MSHIPTNAMPRAGQIEEEQAQSTGETSSAGGAFGQIADKAVECGTVKPDPQLFPGSSIPGLENIPNINEVQDILENLSSTLVPQQ